MGAGLRCEIMEWWNIGRLVFQGYYPSFQLKQIPYPEYGLYVL
jgi:hypothetical protein